MQQTKVKQALTEKPACAWTQAELKELTEASEGTLRCRHNHEAAQGREKIMGNAESSSHPPLELREEDVIFRKWAAALYSTACLKPTHVFPFLWGLILVLKIDCDLGLCPLSNWLIFHY